MRKECCIFLSRVDKATGMPVFDFFLLMQWNNPVCVSLQKYIEAGTILALQWYPSFLN